MLRNNKLVIGALALIVVGGLYLTYFRNSEVTTHRFTTNIMEVPKEISIEEVKDITERWGESLVGISSAFREGEDYVALAAETLDTLYGFEYKQVLFKPTLSVEQPFRGTWEEAASYFIGASAGEEIWIEEDGEGFATNPWFSVEFEHDNALFEQVGEQFLWMGKVHIEGEEGEITTVHKTMGFFRDTEGNIRINLHHSSVPFN